MEKLIPTQMPMLVVKIASLQVVVMESKMTEKLAMMAMISMMMSAETIALTVVMEMLTKEKTVTKAISMATLTETAAKIVLFLTVEMVS
jgi:hypothetical protein